MASAGDNDPDGEVEALRERLDSGSVAFGDVILLKHWQTLEGDGSEAKRRFGEDRYYQELERFQSSEGGNAVDVAVFGGAALGVYLTPDGTFKWTVIGRTIWFDWSEAYRLAYRVDAVAEKAREWWGSRDQVAPDSPGARQKTASDQESESKWRPERRWRSAREDARRRQRRTELRRHLDRAYSLTSAIFSAISRENVLHDSGDTGEPQKPSERYHQNLAVLIPEVEDAEARFRLAAERDAQVLYARGMVFGAIAVAILAAAIAVAFGVARVPAQYGVAFPAGAFGGLVSVLQRMTSGSLKLDFNAGKSMLVAFGAARPMVGGVFGMALFCLLKGGLVPAIVIPTHQELAFYAAAGFLAGFNERFAQDTLATLHVG